MGADQEGIWTWLGANPMSLDNLRKEASFESIPSVPANTMSICDDKPKLFLVENSSQLYLCLSHHQWIDRMWSDQKLLYFHYPIILLNVMIFLFGTTGNVFVCLSVYRNHQLRNVTNYFIVNLAVADLLVIVICLPATVIWDLSLTWFFGTLCCKLIMFLQDVSVSVSVLTLTAISIDRYYAFCHPLKFKSNLRQAKRIILLIWLISFLIMAPDLIYLRAELSSELAANGFDTLLYSDCDYSWPAHSSRVFQFVKTFVLYLLPLALMFAAHFRIMKALRQHHSSTYQTASHSLEVSVSNQPANSDESPPFAACVALANSHFRSLSKYSRQLGMTSSNQEEHKLANTTAATSGEADSSIAITSDHLRACPSPLPVGSELASASSAPCNLGIMTALTESAQPSPTLVATRLRAGCPRRVSRKIKLRAANEVNRGRGIACHNGDLNKSKGSESTDQPEEMSAGEDEDDLIDDEYDHEDELDDEEEEVDQENEEQPNNGPHFKPAAKTRADSSSKRRVPLPGRSGGRKRHNQERRDLQQVHLIMHNKAKLESRRTATKMLTAIVILFGLCYLPVHLINSLRQFIEDIPQNDVISTISMLAHSLCYLNSAINPLIYNYMNCLFRAEFRKFLSFCFSWKQKRSSSDDQESGQVTASNFQPFNKASLRGQRSRAELSGLICFDEKPTIGPLNNHLRASCLPEVKLQPDKTKLAPIDGFPTKNNVSPSSRSLEIGPVSSPHLAHQLRPLAPTQTFMKTNKRPKRKGWINRSCNNNTSRGKDYIINTKKAEHHIGQLSP